MTPDLLRNRRLDLLLSYTASLDFTGRMTKKDPENATLVSEIAMLLLPPTGWDKSSRVRLA